MDGNGGYEYDYRFSTDDEIIPHYEDYIIDGQMKNILFDFKTNEEIIPQFDDVAGGKKSFVFEIRTKFIVKKIDEDEIMGSERFHSCHEQLHKYILIGQWSYRLEDYWMTPNEIDRFATAAYAFASMLQMVVVDQDRDHVFPVVIDLQVCTVQGETESVAETVERSISPERLVPLDLWKRTPHDLQMSSFLLYTPRIKVKNVDEGLALMSVCAICSRKPTIGTRISTLNCGHSYHSHCLVRLIQRTSHCPICRTYADPVSKSKLKLKF